MLKIAHRVNTIDELKKIPFDCGVEIDVRHDNQSNSLYLNHDPGVGESLINYLKHFHHRFIVFNIKEAGIEQQCIDLAKKYHIPKENYFLLDVEFPYFYQATRKKNIKEIATRYSEAEPIEMALTQKGFVNWVWIDTNTQLPLNSLVTKQLMGFKTCLVSPDRWGRPEDILIYRQNMQALAFKPDAIMVGFEHMALWDDKV